MSGRSGRTASTTAAGNLTLSNALGDEMVLQRAPGTSVVWGFGTPGVAVSTTFLGAELTPPAIIDADGVWRQTLPPTAPLASATTIMFNASDGGSARLRDVLFGDVLLCSGQCVGPSTSTLPRACPRGSPAGH